MVDPKFQVEYVLDVSKKPLFVPVITNKHKQIFLAYEEAEEANGECNGILIGIIHREGFKKLDVWKKKNPDWEEKYFPN